MIFANFFTIIRMQIDVFNAESLEEDDATLHDQSVGDSKSAR